MFIDIVFPKGNENEFARIASILGTKTLCMSYSKAGVKETKDALAAGNKYKLKILIGSEKETNNSEITIIQTDEVKDDIQKKKAEILFGFENSPGKDHYYQKKSGLDEVAAKSAKQKRIVIGFAFSSIISRSRAKNMGRISQNIMLLRKYKFPATIGSFAKNPLEMRSGHDLRYLYQYLGMSTSESKAAINGLSSYLEDRKIIR